MDKKKTIIIVSAAIIVIAAIIACFVCFGGKKSKADKGNKAELTANLEKLGRSFYEDFYYDRNAEKQEDYAKFFAQFSETGITADLENIAKVSSADKELIDSMVNSKTKEKCDVKESKVTFYPKEPYGKTDYDVKVVLVCGFDEEK